MKTFFQDRLKGDPTIWIITFLFIGASIFSVYSFISILQKVDGISPFAQVLKHLFFIGLSLVVMFQTSRMSQFNFVKISELLFYISILLLLWTLFFGVRINEASRWISVFGFTFQPSDLARLGLVLYLSKQLTAKKDKLDDWKEGMFSLLWPIFLVCALIFTQNFSTALILFTMSMMLLYIGRVPISKFITILIAGASMIAIVVMAHLSFPKFNLLPRYETWKNRIFNSYDGVDGAGDLQQTIASQAIHNGGIFGQGPGDGKLKGYLPEAYADFYYASFVEEFGLIFAVILIFVYLILFQRIVSIGLKSDKLFDTYACIGIGIIILSQAVINALVCTGIFPVTGQNMPLLAMGGTSLLVTCLSLGIVQSIAAKTKKGKSLNQTETA
jgi:cell division protein FtsW